MHGKNVIVTGAASGLGKATAQVLAGAGAAIAIIDVNESGAKAVADEINGRGGRAVNIHGDITRRESAHALFGKAVDSLGRIHGLINNAGIYPDEGISVLTISREQLVNTFQTNTFGALEITQAFLPYLKRSAAARVVNVSSGYGQLDGLSANVPSYCLSKLALNGVTIMLAAALKEHQIAVNSMCPGWVRTDMGGSGAPRSVQEGADTAVWLATEADQNLTGKFFRDRKEIAW